jgi:hypothetical protein
MGMHITWKQAVLALGLAIIAAVAFVRFSPLVAQDACLDSGGAWRDGQCQH